MKANFTRTQNMRQKHFALRGLVLYAYLAAHVTYTQAYSQVQVSGSGDSNEGPKIFKALNMDLIYPRTFNSSENVISTTQTPQLSATTAAPGSLQGSQYAPPPSHQQQQQSAILYVTPANEALPTVGAAAEAFGAIAANSGQESGETAGDNPARTQVPASPLLTADDEQQQRQQQPAEAFAAAEHDPQQQQQLQEYASTGRAVDYRPSSAYNLNRLITPLIKNSARPVRPPDDSTGRRPIYVRPAPAQSTSGIGKIIYPQINRQQQRQPNRAEINKLRGQATFSDRFTPGEAVASSQFAKHHHNHHQHNHKPSASKNNGHKVPASSSIVQTYTPPKNLYSFPPNTNAKYPPPAQDPKAALPSSSVNSYVAPPSGPISSISGYPLATASSNSNGYKYSGPVSPAYLPPDSSDDDMKTEDAPKSPADAADNDEDNDDTIGVLPASAMDPMGNDAKDATADSGDNGDMDMTGEEEHDHPPPDDDKEYPTPPPGWVEEHPDSAHDHPPVDHPHDDHSHDIPSIHDHPIIYDHDHDHDHGHYFDHHFDLSDHFPSYPHYFHHHPEIIYDDHHDHHHIETPPPTLPPITTELPPEPAPEPRVKKYSYFYIGRKLWYIPLYFTVWFSFYVLWLILKSIARHKVNLPNHYVNRRSLPDSPDKQAQEYINQLTVAVLQKIDDYSRKQQ